MKPTALLLTLALTPLAPAQSVGTTIGPNPVPLGCDLSITVSIDYPGVGSSTFCPFQVYDAAMDLVYDPGVGSPCDQTPALIGPWGWVNATWDLRDQAGVPVPPGDYWIRVTYDVGGPTFHPVQVGGAETGLVLQGTGTIYETLGGESRSFYLCSPNDPGEIHWLLASLGAGSPLSTCGGSFPLEVDSLLLASLANPNLFPGSFANFDGGGASTAPRLDLPENPNLIGLDLWFAFVVLDVAAPCPIRRISSALEVPVIG